MKKERKNPYRNLGRWKINVDGQRSEMELGNTIFFRSPGPMSWWTRFWNTVYYATIFKITRKGLKVKKVESENLIGCYEVVLYHGRLEITEEVNEMAMRSLTEEQISWIIQEIKDTKDAHYTGEDYAGVLDNWDVEDFEDMTQDELDFLEGLYNALR